MPINAVPAKGERMVICGQTGSGKTAFACHLLDHMAHSRIVIYDTKGEPKFPGWFLDAPLHGSMDALVKDARKADGPDVFILRPPLDILSDPEALDDLLYQHYRRLPSVGAYVDEAYQFHRGSQAGRGLIGLLTRGRSRGITTVVSTQRPAWLSRFALTEAQRFAIFRLNDRADRKRLGELVPDFEDLPLLPKYHYFYFDYDLDGPIRAAPIVLRKDLANYVDIASHFVDNGTDDRPLPRLRWL